MPSGSLTSKPQDVPDDSNPPAEYVKTLPELLDGKEPEVMVEHFHAGEDNSQMDVTNENEQEMTNKLDMTNEMDMANGNELVWKRVLWRFGKMLSQTILKCLTKKLKMKKVAN